MEEMKEKLKQTAWRYGFETEDVRRIPGMKADAWQMRYVKNGARLLWLKREEENKTFAISFKTIPKDDTGVFHILEHSVLCGSEKYPVSKPFVEMVKSSLQTFMNAFTFPDKTMYPLSSRNWQDFLNLMDVYLDAVFHPLCITKKNIFQQEGWHYELESPEGEAGINGVVYSEMQGASASLDSVITATLNRQLFPDTCYHCESGGAPEHIPELTYESYVESYKKYYHPSNAYIFLDGDIDIEPVLAKLDGVLGSFERQTADISIDIQKPVCPGEVYSTYETGEGVTEGKTVLAGGWVYGRFDEMEKNLACAALAELLCSTCDTPLKRALVGQGLAEDAELAKEDGILQPYVTLIVRNVSEEKKEEIWDCVREVLREQAETGVDKKRLTAILNHMEFSMREKDYGNMPAGIVYAMRTMESWLYGGRPTQRLWYGQVFDTLRTGIEEGYFERLIQEIFLNNPHHARIVLRPSVILGEERRARERSRINRSAALWTPEIKKQIVEDFRHLRAVQETPDAPERVKMLPHLGIADIEETQREIPSRCICAGKNKVLVHEIQTEGIIHLTWHFSLADCTLEELSEVSLLQVLLGQTETDHYDAASLQAELNGNLGRFSVQMEVQAEQGQIKRCVPYLVVSISVLAKQMDEAARLADEVLNHTKFKDVSYLRSRIKQLRMSFEQHILMAGDSYGMRRVQASFSAAGAASEYMEGIQMFRWLKELDDHFEEQGEELTERLAVLCRRIFVRERAVLSITGELQDVWPEKLLRIFQEGTGTGLAEYMLEPVKKESIRIPADIGFAAMGGNLAVCGGEYTGAVQVAARILSYGYLWNEIRVKGGAYGTRMSVNGNGDVCFTSYRDPDPGRSLMGFAKAGEELRRLAKSGEPLDKYIISTIAATEPLLGARQKGRQETAWYLSGVTREQRKKIRSEILHTTGEELAHTGDMLDALAARAGVCLLGSDVLIS